MSCGVEWGYSSAGRAPALQAGGREFESLYLHLGAALDCKSKTPVYIENYITRSKAKKVTKG